MQEQNTLSVSQYNTHIRVLRKACIVIAKKREEKIKDLYFIIPLQATFMHVSCAINNAFNATLFVRAMRSIVMRDSCKSMNNGTKFRVLATVSY